MNTAVELPDDSTRPKAPKISGVSESQRHSGRHLAMIHAMHLRELSRVNQAMEQVFEGKGSAQTLLTTISSMQMVANMRRFGNLCGAACDLLTGHHSIEDHYVFPGLIGHSAALDKVVQRLKAEHLVIHDLLVRLEAAAVALVTNSSKQNALVLREEYKRLEAFVVSHFGYEQTELEEALGYYGVQV
jgi:Hemerythrin HHE cation binding domain